MESRFDRRELLFQPRGIPPLGTSLSLALQHLVAMIVGCVTPPIIIAGAIGLSQCAHSSSCIPSAGGSALACR